MNLAFLHCLDPRGNNCSHRYRAEKMSELGFSAILYLHFSWFLFPQYWLPVNVHPAAQQGSVVTLTSGVSYHSKKKV